MIVRQQKGHNLDKHFLTGKEERKLKIKRQKLKMLRTSNNKNQKVKLLIDVKT